ncbi:hypothetical protein, partial [Klebsiella variicola]|uniref:hypothetical protein n=1 Tax=Klebsiella variicola TaxID=244366 RepID=UPI001BD4212F
TGSAAKKKIYFIFGRNEKHPQESALLREAISPRSSFQRSPKETFANSIPLAYMENKFHNTIETEQTFP